MRRRTKLIGLLTDISKENILFEFDESVSDEIRDAVKESYSRFIRDFNEAKLITGDARNNFLFNQAASGCNRLKHP